LTLVGFVVRQQQMAAFQMMAEERFVLQTMEHMREYHPEQVLGLDHGTLRGSIEAAIARARTYGLTWESSITGFVALSFLLGRNFDRYPRIQAVLTDARIPANERLDYLGHSMTPTDWARVAAEGGD
jgi:hypothetical protein